uniref:Uncharacterized protein n=1 Tax=Arundo donax TaxID=35708 RepID=A0A0A9CDH6_ARUDO
MVQVRQVFLQILLQFYQSPAIQLPSLLIRKNRNLPCFFRHMIQSD